MSHSSPPNILLFIFPPYHSASNSSTENIVFGLNITPSKGFPGGSVGKESACNVGEPGWIPGLGRSPGEGNGNPLQYSCLENSMNKGAWWAIVQRVAKSRIQVK